MPGYHIKTKAAKSRLKAKALKKSKPKKKMSYNNSTGY